MTPRERVLTALQHERPDRTPCDFWAEPPTWKVLPCSTPEQVRAIAQRYCSSLGAGGGYILGPAHLFQPDVPPENILAVYAAERERYRCVEPATIRTALPCATVPGPPGSC